MKVKDMPMLYVESLKDLYSAETQLVEALPKVIERITASELKAAVTGHLRETEGHVTRLEKMIKELDEDPKGHTCKAMQGLIKEADELMTDVKDPEVLDAAIIGAAQKVEHYEISGYGTARTFARLLGHEKHAVTLQTTLDEEYAADDKMTEIAESFINRRAATGGKVKSEVR